MEEVATNALAVRADYEGKKGEGVERMAFEVALEGADLQDLMRGLDQIRQQSNDYFGQLIDQAEKTKKDQQRQNNKKSKGAV